MAPPLQPSERIRMTCRDGVQLGGHFWPAIGEPQGFVVINPATGVLARYYHPYASFLAGHGYDVLTYDYRGIGASRPDRLRGCGYRWRDWGQLDFDAAIRLAAEKRRAGPLLVVGHSVGGFLPGLAESGPLVDRLLTVGAQYAYWPDYARAQRLHLFLKWHVAMPVLTALVGYFPGKRLGWLEDLPAGVANEWSFKRRRTEWSYPAETRADVLARFAAFRAPILAIAVTDDELGTVAAIQRTLAYYSGAGRQQVVLSPGDIRVEAIGHFGLFHARFADSFWPASLLWLRDGINPWADRA
ncbi:MULTISPECIES: alpha/beta fold hydrolase [unclassified Beijerinckia]|uniref:alpha/beta hydrolase family protein n=1 Tax=unclassified Beijerinckia TaxID=2638183 RepID=UPI000899E358|nr:MULTISPECIES: alpha/beta fold hydrolase [unclassified Beijerinckia]MDH7795125.1 putative alpha/beta hydrolase [Beijerinckia sp. GAS462]SEB88526.1 Predicted alpha/beta hydrolase [Beijerinckia sp. 28-YEA-48]